MRREAEVLGRYLLGGKLPSEKVIALYIAAHEKKPVLLTRKEEKRLRFMLRNRWAIGLVDGALGFSKEASGGIRRKLLYLSAILETQPEYADLFLPKARSWSYNLFIFRVGCRAVLKAIVGKMLLVLI